MKLLVHFHVYYHDQVLWFLGKLSHITDCDWDLLVTYSEPHPDTEAAVRAFKPDVRFLQVENAGYDIWPFIRAIRSVDIDAYDYVLKLHTKGRAARRASVNGLSLRGYRWRNYLVNSLLRTPESFRSALQILETKPEAGIVCCGPLIRKLHDALPEENRLLQEELDRIGMHPEHTEFCAGTMFLARMAPFKTIRDLDLQASSFGGEAVSHSLGTPAHVYERILCFAVTQEGYSIEPVHYPRAAYDYVKVSHVFQPFLQKIFRLDRRGDDRTKYLTIFGINIKLSE